CQESELTKHEYHTLLGEAKMVFSANLQETLGISCFEGAVVNTMPLVPNMLSYAEMYDEQWKYPSDWVLKKGDYHNYGKSLLIEKIKDMMSNYNNYLKLLPRLSGELQRKFFSANNLIDKLFEEK